MSTSEDYYKTLEISRDASSEDIQKAYRKLARKYHPDLNPDDKTAKEKFQNVQRAFDVLNDPSKREMYDRYGSAFDHMGGGPHPGAGHGQSGAGRGGFPGGGADFDFDFSQFFGGGGGGGSGGFGDIFGQFRQGQGQGGGRSRRTRQARNEGANIQSSIEISFQTAVVGGEVEISIPRAGGTSQKLHVKIPIGIDDGGKIRLRGQGEPGDPPGDLILTVNVQPHPAFTRRENHLDLKLPITLSEAISGAKVDVPTPQGIITLSIPPGTSSGTKLRAKGRGIAPAKGEPGNLYAEVQIVLPKNLDEETKARLRQLEEEQPLEPRSDLRW